MPCAVHGFAGCGGLPPVTSITAPKSTAPHRATTSQSSANASNQLSVEYGKFSHGHIEQNDKGGVEPAVESGWDFVENQPFSTSVDSDLF